MSDTTIHFCGNIMLKSVKCVFLGIPTFWVFYKSPPIFSRGSEFILVFKLVLKRLQRTILAKKKVKFNCWKKNAFFDQNCNF